MTENGTKTDGSEQTQYESVCPDCDWSEVADSPLGAYFAGRRHYFDSGQEHVPLTEKRSVDTDTEQ